MQLYSGRSKTQLNSTHNIHPRLTHAAQIHICPLDSRVGQLDSDDTPLSQDPCRQFTQRVTTERRSMSCSGCDTQDTQDAQDAHALAQCTSVILNVSQ